MANTTVDDCAKWLDAEVFNSLILKKLEDFFNDLNLYEVESACASVAQIVGDQARLIPKATLMRYMQALQTHGVTIVRAK